jgi:hypothetical protein
MQAEGLERGRLGGGHVELAKSVAMAGAAGWFCHKRGDDVSRLPALRQQDYS